MDNRAALEFLPDDLKFILGLLLPGRDLLNLRHVSRTLRMFYNDHAFWIRKYNADFGPLPLPDDTSDIKAQYLAAEMHQQVKHCKRPDIMQIKSNYLHQFLQHHQNRPWTRYYLGVMSWFGAGVPLSHENGVNHLLDSFNAGDYRAALYLSFILAGRPEWMSVIHGSEQALINNLAATYQDNAAKAYRKTVNANIAARAALMTARLYQQGAVVTRDTTAAEAWYMHALDHGNPEAVNPLVGLIKSHAEKGKAYPHSAIVFLEQQVARVKTENRAHAEIVLAEIHYQSGLLYKSLQCLEEAETKFALASVANHGAALYQYAMCYQQKAAAEIEPELQTEYNKLHRLYMKKSTQAGDKNAVIERYKNMAAYKETVADFEEEFLAGNAQADILAERIGVEHCYSRAESSKDPVRIWWMQLCIQCIQNNKMPVRINFELMTPKVTDRFPMNENVIYSLCARGIIYLFGVMGTTLAADYKRAKIYFERVLTADPRAMDKYLAAGRKRNIISAEMEKIIRVEMNTALQMNPSCEAPCIVSIP